MGVSYELLLKVWLEYDSIDTVKDCVLNYTPNFDLFFGTYGYHHGDAIISFDNNDNLFLRVDQKQASKAIKEFLNWLHPHLSHDDGDCIGWVWNDMYQTPRMLIYRDTFIEYKEYN